MNIQISFHNPFRSIVSVLTSLSGILIFLIFSYANFDLSGEEKDELLQVKRIFSGEWKKKNFPFSFEFGSGEESCKNDFNLDGIEDVALTMRIQSQDSSNESATDQNGFLAIALGSQNGKYVFDSMIPIIPCNSCGGVYGKPDVGLKCVRDKILVSSYGGSNWRWSNVETIRWRKSGWQWIGTDSYSYHTSFGDGLKHSFNRINLDSTRSYEGRTESEQEVVSAREEVRFKKIFSTQSQNRFDIRESWDFLPTLPFEIQDKNRLIEGHSSWKGPQDLSFRVKSGWNSDSLAVAVNVTDDQIRSCSSKSFDCDGVDIVLDPDSSILDFDTNQGVRKKLGSKSISISLRLQPNEETILLLNGKKVSGKNLEARSKKTADGYTIQTKISWNLFGKEYESRLKDGFEFLANIAIVDFDDSPQSQKRMSTSEFKNQDPYTLGELKLSTEKYSLGPWKESP
ncbi:hypothetical protein EHQ76_04615 [Leptospira barantonii]|uniref:Carbohydrate-binding domain-containing protein n=1 Tax=Leptospira barantonii TaxID=2023184 RepID=A0A5F2BP03_9LEPT|nr:sugar-binding protein [Leptospira barantonii]TGM07284.1 hypothetical protein EHQ76_04615 [Leptospira barantonii]